MPTREPELSGVSWETVVQEVVTGLRDWRTAHPQATFAELETAVEERLGVLRASLLQEAALAAVAAPAAAPCALCGAALERRDQADRHLQIQGGQHLRLSRPYLTCTTCERGLFPPR